MKTKPGSGMRIGLSASIAVSVMLLFATAAVSAETVVSIENVCALPDEVVTADITAHNVTNLTQFGIKLEYDPSVVIATSAENNPNLPDMMLGESLHDFSHASEGWVSLACNPYTATPVSGAEVVLTTVTLKAVGTRKENTPPTIEFTAPTPENNSINTTGDINVTVTVTDLSDIDVVKVYLNNTNTTLAFDGHKYHYIDNVSSPDTPLQNYTYTGISLPNGNYQYKVYATDTAGNGSSLNLKIIQLKDSEDNPIPATPVNGTFIIPGNMGMSETRVVTVNVTGELPKTGNMDGAGTVDFNDVLYLARYVILGADDYPLHADGNVDSINGVDFADAMYLARYVILGADDYPLYP